jgi:acetyltransferase
MVKFHPDAFRPKVYLRYFYWLSLSGARGPGAVISYLYGLRSRDGPGGGPKDQTTGQHRIVGLGRLIKQHARNKAEVAVLISDQCQRRGLGTELLSKLVQVARDEKLSRISAEMLGDNLGMQTIFGKLGFRRSLSPDLPIAQVIG